MKDVRAFTGCFVVLLVSACRPVAVSVPPVPANMPLALASATLVADSAWAFRSNTVLADASDELGSDLSQEEVSLAMQGTQVTLSVSGESRQLAIARCKALVRAGLRSRDAMARGIEHALLQQVEAIRRDLSALDRSLEETPAQSTYLEGATTPAQARALAAKYISELTAAEEIPGRLGLPALDAIASEYYEELAHQQRLAARYGSMHPYMLAADSRLRAIRRDWQQQRQIDLDGLRALVKELGSGSLWRARILAMATVLETSGVPADAPVRLRLLASEYRHARRIEELLAATYGDQHPELLGARARVAALGSELDSGRVTTARALRAQLASGEVAAQTDPRAARERDQHLTLVRTLERLDFWRDAAKPRMDVVVDCR